MALKTTRLWEHYRAVVVKDEDGNEVYKFSMATMKNCHIGGALTEAEWLEGEKQALALAKERIDGRDS